MRVLRLALELESGVRSARRRLLIAQSLHYSFSALFFPSVFANFHKDGRLLRTSVRKRVTSVEREVSSIGRSAEMRSHKANFFSAGKVHRVARWKRAKGLQFMSRNAKAPTWNSTPVFPRENSRASARFSAHFFVRASGTKGAFPRFPRVPSFATVRVSNSPQLFALWWSRSRIARSNGFLDFARVVPLFAVILI